MTTRDRVSLALAALAVAVAIFAIGGAPRWSQACVAVLVAAAIAVNLLSKRKFERRPPLLILLGVASVWTFVQWLQLPEMVVHALTPTLDTLRADGTALAGVDAPSTLSMDRAATLNALTFLITLSGLAFVALRASASERGRYFLTATVAGLATLAGATAAIHELLGATKLYGIYEPQQLPPILGPLINTNHLGGLLAIGALTSTGLALYPKQRGVVRVAWVAAAGGCIAITMMTYSRGAVVGLAAGMLILGATFIAQRMYASEIAQTRKRRDRMLTTTLPIMLIIVCALIATVYVGAGTMMNQLEKTSLDELRAPRTKYAAWVSSTELIEESPWVGVGRGAFESTFTRVHPASAYATFSHPENEAVQAVVEWGIPATLLFAFLAGWVVLIAVRRWKDGPLAAGGLGALVAIALQSNFDFGLELLGVAAPIIVILGTLTYGSLVEMPRTRTRHARLLRAAQAFAVLAGAALLMTQATRTLRDDHEALRGRPTTEVIASTIAAHPLDYLAYSTLADARARSNSRDAVRLLNHALRLHPTHPGLHWIAARMLARAGRLGQAETEYSMVVRYSTNPKAVIAELVTVLPPEQAARAIPQDMSIDNTLRYVRLDIARLWLEGILEHSKNIRAADALYSLGLRTKDWAMAESGSRHRCRMMPSDRCTIELAKTLELQGKYTGVIDTLKTVTTWRGRREDQLTAWQMLCGAYRSAGQNDDALECTHRLSASGLQEQL